MINLKSPTQEGMMHNDNILSSYFGRRLYAARIAKKLISESRSKPDFFVITYDNLASPPTIGDLLYVVMCARFFAAKGFKVIFHLIDDGYRSDWEALSDHEIKKFVELQLTIIKSFTSKLQIDVKKISFLDHVNEVKNSANKKNVFFCKNETLHRLRVYAYSFNILNYLLSSETNEFLEKFLLSSASLKTKNQNSVTHKNYVTWHVRRNLIWGQDRNLNDYEFFEYYDRIRLRHGNKIIILISDLDSIEYYMNLAAKKNLQLEQSKFYGDSFVDDSYLVLNSDFYYQFKGGGMGVVALMSDLPFEIVSVTTCENYWRHPTFTSWQNPSQDFKADIRLVDPTFYLELFRK